MPTSFFLLLRFFLRVDGVLIRINDTRLYHEASVTGLSWEIAID
jgi:type 2A phosphatase activator TIP41